MFGCVTARCTGQFGVGGTIPTGVSRCWVAYDPVGRATQHAESEGAAEQRDEADEGRMEAGRGMVRASRHGVAATKDHGGVVRPSQLIASVLRTVRGV